MALTLAQIQENRDGADALELLEQVEQQLQSTKDAVATQLSGAGTSGAVKATLGALPKEDRIALRARFKVLCDFCGMKLADYLGAEE